MNRTRVRAALALAALFGLALSGCGESQPAGPADGMSVAQTVTEYQAEAQLLTLAPGWKWPADPGFESESEGMPVNYQKGFGKKEADYYWYCSWTSMAIDQTASKQDRDTALATVLKVRDTYFYSSGLEAESRRFFESILQKAALGDLSGLANDFQLNCPQKTK